MRFVPYITFPGTAEEALNFYSQAIGGEKDAIMKWREMPNNEGMPPVSEELNDKIMHSEFKIDGKAVFHAADHASPSSGSTGTNVSILINFDDEKSISDSFEKMSEGGKITMPLENTFWGSRYGQLQDKFGINWMFNYPLPGQEGQSNSTNN